MDELGWLLVWLGCTVVICLVAGKRGRNWVMLFVTLCALALAAVLGVSFGLGNDMSAKGWALPLVAWLVLLGGLLWALMAANGVELAERRGSFGGLKRCPFCAEAIKQQAVKCKHCASSLSVD